MSDAPLRLRFAPSPTGFFHVGGARTALYNWVLAKRLGGTFVLRIEDTDEARNSPEWTQGIIDALAWLEISADDPAFEGPYFQSRHRDAHIAAARKLFDTGQAYYCDLTSEQIAERAKASGVQGYDGSSRDRGLGPGPGHVLRFRVPDGETIVEDLVRGRVEFNNDTIEDFVLLRSNGSPMFLLANVVDDMDEKINLVIRAEEHLPNTPKQQLLWDALGEPPPQWAHVPVLVNEQRKKLSKRRDKVALEQYRDEGYVMGAMRNYLMTLGWAPAGDQEIVAWSQIEGEFTLDAVNRSPAFFDLKKLAAFNGEYIRMMSREEFAHAARPFVDAWFAANPQATMNESWLATMLPLLQTRIVTLAEVPAQIDFLFIGDPVIDDDSWAKAMKDPAPQVLADVISAYAQTPWNADALKDTLDAVGQTYGLKLGKTQAPIRVAVTGQRVGPPLFEPLELLGRDETIRRLQAAATRIASTR